MKPQYQLDKLPRPMPVSLLAATDDVGRALRSTFSVPTRLPPEFAALLARLDGAATGAHPD